MNQDSRTWFKQKKPEVQEQAKLQKSKLGPLNGRIRGNFQGWWTAFRWLLEYSFDKTTELRTEPVYFTLRKICLNFKINN